MKKIVWIFLIGGFLISANVSAQTTSSEDSKTTSVQQRGQFVDADNDGVCDHAPQGRQQRRLQNFVDANNDGICDNARESGRKGQGFRKGNRAGGNCKATEGRRGYGRANRIDANKDKN